VAEEDVPRPSCGCGSPATHQIDITVRRLVLDRDAGPYTAPYWTPSYKATSQSVSAMVCEGCHRRDINITLSVSAAVEKATQK
jgi:hypothetical protein